LLIHLFEKYYKRPIVYLVFGAELAFLCAATLIVKHDGMLPKPDAPNMKYLTPWDAFARCVVVLCALVPILLVRTVVWMVTMGYGVWKYGARCGLGLGAEGQQWFSVVTKALYVGWLHCLGLLNALDRFHMRNMWVPNKMDKREMYEWVTEEWAYLDEEREMEESV
jgi:hypothetical protein